MDHFVKPWEGVDDIKFGMTADEVHAAIGLPLARFYRASTCNCGSVTEEFDELFVECDETDMCGLIEVFGGTVFLEGIQLLGVEYVEALKALLTIDESISCNNAGCDSPKYGVSLYVPDAIDLAYGESEPPLVKAVSVFPRGGRNDPFSGKPADHGLSPREWLEKLMAERRVY